MSRGTMPTERGPEGAVGLLAPENPPGYFSGNMPAPEVAEARHPVIRAPQGWIGVLLIAICWPLNWTLSGMRTAYLFFPLWLGYILVIDGLAQARTGSSLWKRSRRDFVLLFV